MRPDTNQKKKKNGPADNVKSSEIFPVRMTSLQKMKRQIKTNVCIFKIDGKFSSPIISSNDREREREKKKANYKIHIRP